MASDLSLSGSPFASCSTYVVMSLIPRWPFSLKYIPTLWTVVLLCVTFPKCSHNPDLIPLLVCPTYILSHDLQIMH